MKRRKPISFDYRSNKEREWHEGIEREDGPRTPGVHWTQEEMREYVRSFSSLEDLLVQLKGE